MSETGSGGDNRADGAVAGARGGTSASAGARGGTSAGAGAGARGGTSAGAGADAGAGLEAGRPLHARSFKLRFAANREQGRSYVSLVKPLGLPATVTNKFYSRVQPAAAGEQQEAEARALRRIRDLFERGPSRVYLEPVTTSHQYGWWWRLGEGEGEGGGRTAARDRWDRRLHHHIRDSAWLKARLLVLAADDQLKRR